MSKRRLLTQSEEMKKHAEESNDLEEHLKESLQLMKEGTKVITGDRFALPVTK